MNPSPAPAPAPTRFDRDTAIREIGPNRYAARIDSGWWIVRGPNGGYLAAILVRALEAAVDEPARQLRSLTIHYASAPVEGEAQITTRLERSGRSLSTASVRLEQDGRLIALALAALSKPWPGKEFDQARMPELPPPEDLPRTMGRGGRRDLESQRGFAGTVAPACGGDERSAGGPGLTPPTDWGTENAMATQSFFYGFYFSWFSTRAWGSA